MVARRRRILFELLIGPGISVTRPSSVIGRSLGTRLRDSHGRVTRNLGYTSKASSVFQLSSCGGVAAEALHSTLSHLACSFCLFPFPSSTWQFFLQLGLPCFLPSFRFHSGAGGAWRNLPPAFSPTLTSGSVMGYIFGLNVPSPCRG